MESFSMRVRLLCLLLVLTVIVSIANSDDDTSWNVNIKFVSARIGDNEERMVHGSFVCWFNKPFENVSHAFKSVLIHRKMS